MAVDRRILEGIEACRPGSADLQSAELADVAREVESDPQALAAYKAVQDWDAAVSAALEQVPIPTGLAERIVDRLKSAETAATAGNAALQLPSSVDDRTLVEHPTAGSPISHDKTGSRKRWLAAASALAATLVAAVLIGQHLRSDSEVPLETQAEAWLAVLGSQWHDMGEAPQGFEIPSAVLAVPAGWQRVSQSTAARGVVFRLVHKNAGTAKLFVMRLAVAGLPASPPGVPQSSTQGKSIGYWRSGAYVYVLVVEGNERDYRTFVDSSRRPFA